MGLSMEATIYVNHETDPWVIKFNPDNGCVSLMLSGTDFVDPHVKLYGTHGEIIQYLNRALSAVLTHSHLQKAEAAEQEVR